jgi:hypothetical protein
MRKNITGLEGRPRKMFIGTGAFEVYFVFPSHQEERSVGPGEFGSWTKTKPIQSIQSESH